MEIVLETDKALEQASGFLPAQPPFDFSQSLRFLEGFTPTEGEQSLTTQQITKAISLKGQAVVFTVWAAEQPGLNYLLQARKLDPETIGLAEQAISAFLGLQDDLSELYRVGQNDPAFASVLKARYGYHQVRFLTPFENGVWALLGQRTPMPVARTIKQRFAEKYGPRIAVTDDSGAIKEYVAFPEPQDIAGIDLAELSGVLGNSRKAEYVLNLAQAFLTMLHPAETAKLSREELKERLLAVKGIGEWSSEFTLIRGYGRMGGLPRGEKRLQEIVSRLYNSGKPVTEADIQRFAHPYGEAQGYWAHYLRVGGE